MEQANNIDPIIGKDTPEVISGEGVSFVDANVFVDEGIVRNDGWINRNWKKALVGAAFVAGGSLLIANPSAMSKTVSGIEREASVAYDILPITEGCAWAGAIIMMSSTGKQIGNPLTVKKRLAQIRHELNDNKMYRIGWGLGAVGAIGTSVTISIGSVIALPEASWPLAFGVSAASMVFSTIPFKPSRIVSKDL